MTLLGACGGGTASTPEAPQGATLSAQAALGEKIFSDASLSASGRQSCASCHDPAFGHSPPNALAAQLGGADLDLQGSRKAPGIRYLAANSPFFFAADGTPPLFTDFSYDNLGLPRNPELVRNGDPTYFDLGLCQRADLAARGDLCGAFKVPSLRNVALRQAYFHNGRFKTLKDALTFYVQRDTHPERFYPVDGAGGVAKFDDLPPAYRVNVNTTEAPYNRRPGEAPALSDSEIDDVIAFLKTLSDGYTP
ncbi:MAG TPA: cytochrome c peroxidase [Caldimonas sp.]